MYLLVVSTVSLPGALQAVIKIYNNNSNPNRNLTDRTKPYSLTVRSKYMPLVAMYANFVF